MTQFGREVKSIVIGGLSRVLKPRLISCEGLDFQVFVAPPLSGVTQYVLYVLDPEPERFALYTTNLFSLQGYYRDNDEGANVLRDVAVVGFGRAPSSYSQHSGGFDAVKLRELRRADFMGISSTLFLHGLKMAVSLAEQELLHLPAQVASSHRAVSGFSLSGLMATFAYLDEGELFKTLLGGEVSLQVLRMHKSQLYDEMQQMALNTTNAPGNVLWQLSTHTRGTNPDFAAEMDEFAKTLVSRNHKVVQQSLVHGTHDSVKPLVTLTELEWLQHIWQRPAVDVS